jgi:hypothetical protein
MYIRLIKFGVGEIRNAHEILVREPERKKSLGRPAHIRWYNIKIEVVREVLTGFV